MSTPLTPSKRAHEESPAETNGRGKVQKSAAVSAQNSSSGGILLRVLCPSTKIDNVIGEGDSVISQIRQESGARIRVEDSIPGYDERIIFISTPDKENVDGADEQPQQIKREDDNADNEEKQTAESERNEDNNDKQESTVVEDSQHEKEKEEEKENEKEKEKETASAVLKALLLVFEKMVEGELGKENDGGGDEEGDKSSSFVVRLLVFSSQIGCLLGRAGSVIKQMSSDSGAQIRILPKDKLLAPASPNDELVQVILFVPYGDYCTITMTFLQRDHDFPFFSICLCSVKV